MDRAQEISALILRQIGLPVSFIMLHESTDKSTVLSPSPVTDRRKKTHGTQNFKGEQTFESLVKPTQLLYAA